MSSNKKSVGYKQPPEHSRFKKGQSGNPKGRPKGSRNLNDIAMKEMRARIPIQENGEVRKVTKSEAMMKRYSQKALDGDIKSAQFITPFLQDYEEKEAQRLASRRQAKLLKEDEEIMARLFEILGFHEEEANND